MLHFCSTEHGSWDSQGGQGSQVPLEVRISWMLPKGMIPKLHLIWSRGQEICISKLLMQVWVMMPNQFRVKSCLGEALGRAGAELSWLEMGEAKASIRRCIGRLFGSAGGVQVGFWWIPTGGCLPHDSRRSVSREAGLWKPIGISARAETLIGGVGGAVCPSSLMNEHEWDKRKLVCLEAAGPRVRVVDRRSAWWHLHYSTHVPPHSDHCA